MLSAASSRLNLLSFGYINFYVDNAAYWRDWFISMLDFHAIASLTSTNGDTYSEILEHNNIQIRLSAPLHSNSPVDRYLQKHPPGVAEVAFTVDEDRQEQLSALKWGDLTHSFIKHSSPVTKQQNALFTHIDHLVFNVPDGQMWTAAQWYQQHLGLQFGDRFHIQTQRSALKSIVMTSPDRKIQIPINEPSTTNSQIQEFLDYNRGAGIQHLALHTNDIYRTVATLKKRGLQFLETSPPILQETQDPVTKQSLLQVFTQPIFGEPTFFFEIIQRQNQAQGFGEGNFQALFEAIEREQISRSVGNKS